MLNSSSFVLNNFILYSMRYYIQIIKRSNKKLLAFENEAFTLVIKVEVLRYFKVLK
jgi:hypothetical protein